MPLRNTAIAQTPWMIARPSDPAVINRRACQNWNDDFFVIGRCSSSRVSVTSTVGPPGRKKETSPVRCAVSTRSFLSWVRILIS